MGQNNVGESGLLGRVRVAAPCPVSWDALEGDARVRFCRVCSLNVYNLSAMTRTEAESLVARAEGRLCARLYRRADGTMLTQDCPEGLRAVRRRVRRTAAAVFAAVASLWTAAAGQQTPAAKGEKEKPPAACKDDGQVKIKRKPTPAGEASALTGVALDPAGAVIPGVVVTLLNVQTKEEQRAATDADGVFSFARPAPGTYTLKLAALGFMSQEVRELSVAAGESLRVESVMSVNAGEVEMGVILTDLSHGLDRDSTGITTVFDMKTIRNLPIP